MTQNPGRTPSLLADWRERSERSARIAQWESPAVDAVCSAVEAGDDMIAAVRQLGRERALAGEDLDATFVDVDDLCDALGLLAPPSELLRSVASGWADAMNASATRRACVDPLTGLPTGAYLTVRVAELLTLRQDWPPYPEGLSLLICEGAQEAGFGAFADRMVAGVRWSAHFARTHCLAMGVLQNGVMVAVVPSDLTLDSRVADAVTAVNLGVPDERYRVRRIRLPEVAAEAGSLLASLARR